MMMIIMMVMVMMMMIGYDDVVMIRYDMMIWWNMMMWWCSNDDENYDSGGEPLPGFYSSSDSLGCSGWVRPCPRSSRRWCCSRKVRMLWWWYDDNDDDEDYVIVPQDIDTALEWCKWKLVGISSDFSLSGYMSEWYQSIWIPGTETCPTMKNSCRFS